MKNRLFIAIFFCGVIFLSSPTFADDPQTREQLIQAIAAQPKCDEVLVRGLAKHLKPDDDVVLEAEIMPSSPSYRHRPNGNV